MSRTRHHGKFRIYGDRKDKPDARRLSKALLAWLEAQREAEAQASHDQPKSAKTKRPKKGSAS
jgi:hypothetical protein